MALIGTEVVSIESNQYLKAMKTIVIIILGMFLYTGLSAQENTSQTEAVKSSKSAKKAQREALIQEQFNQTKALINSNQFVLEADYLRNRYGYTKVTNTNLNFIMVDTTNAVIQTGNNTGMGYNGVGGLTASGNITAWKVQMNDRKKTMSVEMNVSTSIGYFNIRMSVLADGKTTATLTGNYAGSLTFSGKLVPLSESYAFKGMSM